jgi:hypothetical protein
MMRIAVAALVAAAVAAPAAAAAPPWSAPQTLSSAHLFVDSPGITFSSDGSALATWGRQDGTTADALVGSDGAFRAPGQDVFRPEQPIGRTHSVRERPPALLGPLAYGRNRALFASVRADRRQRTFRIAARLGTVAGVFAPPRTIARRPHVTSPDLAANARGRAALAWFENRGVATDRVSVSLRPAGGRFRRPVRLATGALRRVAVAVGPRGQVLVAWVDREGVVRTRFKPAGARRFRRADRIESRPAQFAILGPAIAANGSALLAIGSQALSSGGDVGTVRFQAAVRPAGARAFRRAQLLESRNTGVNDQTRVIGVRAGSRWLMAWTGFDGTMRRARVAATGAGHRFGAPQDVSPPGIEAWIGDLAAARDGRALVTWTAGTGDELAGQIQAALAPAGAPFGPPELVSDLQEARLPAAAFDPVGGRPTVVWSNRPEGSARPLDEIETFAQAATRAF